MKTKCVECGRSDVLFYDSVLKDTTCEGCGRIQPKKSNLPKWIRDLLKPKITKLEEPHMSGAYVEYPWKDTKLAITNLCHKCHQHNAILVADGTWYCGDCAEDKIEELSFNYNELIMAVAKKFLNESRHETALRYIREREQRLLSNGCKAERLCKKDAE